MGILDSLRKRKKENKGKELAAFTKTSQSFGAKMRQLFVYGGIDDSFFEELLIILLEADVGFTTADKIVQRVKEQVRKIHNAGFNEVVECLSEQLILLYQEKNPPEYRSNPNGPDITLLVGVNGSGKTTTLAKLAYQLQQSGNKVLAVAADTFRAGATQQLKLWLDSIAVDCLSGNEKADPASVVVDGCRKAKSENYDHLLCDTAGRLQNKANLMNELAKIKRVAEKELGAGVVNCYLVIDATTGQNGLKQAEVFLESCEVNGIILTKIDGSAKGGIILAIKDQLNIAVKYVGSGEKVEDLATFDIEEFVLALTEGLVDAG